MYTYTEANTYLDIHINTVTLLYIYVQNIYMLWILSAHPDRGESSSFPIGQLFVCVTQIFESCFGKGLMCVRYGR